MADIVVLVGTITAGICTLAIWSYLYKENLVYRLFENIFVATGAATSFIFAIKYIQDNTLTPLNQGNTIIIFPTILGLMAYVYYIKQYRYIYRIPVAFLVGVGMALSVRGTLSTNLYTQVIATIQPLVLPNAITSFNNIIILVGVVTSTTYFLFTVKSSSPMNISTKIGRYIIMISFGTEFGQVVMQRMTYFIGRAQFMLQTEAIYLIPIGFTIVIIHYIIQKIKK